MRPTLLCLALLVPGALASDVVETFDGGANPSGWTIGTAEVFPTSGGNPGTWLRTQADTFAPQLRTSVAGSPFHGDWRALGVTSCGVDLRTVSTQFPFAREATLMLSDGTSQVYFLGTEMVPQVAEGWKSIDYAIDAGSPTLPAGWSVLIGSGDDDADWNAIITNVTEVRWFYGDPTFFFIFDIWDIGADNPRLDCADDPWTDLGNGLAGSGGTPVLTGAGPLTAGSTVTLELDGALPGSTAYLVFGLAELSAPFKGGVLVPSVDAFFVLTVSSTGEIDLADTWPSGGSGLSTFWQYWIADAGGPVGFAASNGLQGDVP